jgi:hypothetical protein
MFAASELHNGSTENLRSPNPVSEEPGRDEWQRVKNNVALPEQGNEVLKNL